MMLMIKTKMARMIQIKEPRIIQAKMTGEMQNKDDEDDANKEDRGLSKRATINSTFLPPKTTISCQEMSF